MVSIFWEHFPIKQNTVIKKRFSIKILPISLWLYIFSYEKCQILETKTVHFAALPKKPLEKKDRDDLSVYRKAIYLPRSFVKTKIVIISRF